jgi:hypothetical protein
MDIIRRKQLEKTLRTQSTGIGVRLPPLKKKLEKAEDRVTCFNCQHFRVTGIVATPYACGAYGFRGKQMPSLVVFTTTGEACSLFVPKNG